MLYISVFLPENYLSGEARSYLSRQYRNNEIVGDWAVIATSDFETPTVQWHFDFISGRPGYEHPTEEQWALYITMKRELTKICEVEKL